MRRGGLFAGVFPGVFVGRRGSFGTTLGALALVPAAVLKLAAPGALVGALLGKNPASTLTLTGTAGNRFALAGTTITVGAVAL